MQTPAVWRQIRSAKALARQIPESMGTEFHAIGERYEPGRTVVVASGGAFGARIAHEKLRAPLATVLVQPSALRSVHKMPTGPGILAMLERLPPPAKRALFRLLDVVVDRVFHVSEVNAFRATLDLPPVTRLMKDWWLSPQRVIALFPDWFGTPQPDWPGQLRMTGFPLYDGRVGAGDLPIEVQSFLESGEAPVVITPGSGIMHDHSFIEASVRACELIERRGVLLTRHTEQVPQPLPDSIRHFDYVPFGQLLPHAAAMVHHGGIGTLAQGIATGIPQLIVPMVNDQPDNAQRLKMLGVGDSLKPSEFSASTAARKLHGLLLSSEIAIRCRALAHRLNPADARQQACELVEELAEMPGVHR
jgi:UDP:flavonoid glycosyltransferase YjiC (YdhE family)